MPNADARDGDAGEEEAASGKKWKEEVDPQIKKAKLALDAWGFALTIADPDKVLEKEKLFNMVKGKLLDLLIDQFVEE